MVGLLQFVKDTYFGRPSGKGVIQDLEYAMRTKGGLTEEEDTKLLVVNFLPTAAMVLFAGLGSYGGWFGQALGHRLLGLPPARFSRFIAAAGEVTNSVLKRSELRARRRSHRHHRHRHADDDKFAAL